MTIIEISSENANFKSLQNNIYSITLDPPIEGNTQLNLKTAFLDMRDLGNSANDSFVLNETVSCTIEFTYYEQFNESSGTDTDVKRVNLIGGTDIPFPLDFKYCYKHFVAYLFTPTNTMIDDVNPPQLFTDTKFDSIKLLTNDIKFDIPAGEYTADSIVLFINDKLQRLNLAQRNYQNEGINFSTFTNNYISFQELVDKFVIVEPAQTGNTFFYKTFIGFINVQNDPIIIDNADPKFIGYTYKQLPASSNSSTFQDQTAQFFLGTPEFNLQNLNNKLSFEYLHNPIYSIILNDKDPKFIVSKTEIIIFESNNTPSPVTRILNVMLRRGGINLTRLSPVTFWNDILGFNQDQLLQVENITYSGFRNIAFTPPGFITNGDIFSLNSFITSTTEPLISLTVFDSFINVDNPSIFTDFKLTIPNYNSNPITVEDTVPLVAANVINFADTASGGHLLLEIETNFKVNNYKDGKISKSLSAIMSREYLNDGYLSIMGGSVNIPIPSNSSISTITVFIKDPITKNLVSNLGANNTFYFELD